MTVHWPHPPKRRSAADSQGTNSVICGQIAAIHGMDKQFTSLKLSRFSQLSWLKKYEVTADTKTQIADHARNQWPCAVESIESVVMSVRSSGTEELTISNDMHQSRRWCDYEIAAPLGDLMMPIVTSDAKLL